MQVNILWKPGMGVLFVQAATILIKDRVISDIIHSLVPMAWAVPHVCPPSYEVSPTAL